MLRYGINEATVLGLLSRYSQLHNTKVGELARSLADGMCRSPRVLDALLPDAGR